MTSANPPMSVRARYRHAVRVTLETTLQPTPLAARVFWRLPSSVAGVALTFDDGPDPDITPSVLDTLAAAGVRATFFVVGERARRFPDLVRRMCAEGHAVGNHTFSHARCGLLTPGELRLEIEGTDALLQSLGAGDVPLFRPPYGALRPDQAWRLLRDGRRLAFWSRDSRDYRDIPAEAIAALGGAVAPRDIVLLHDRFASTKAALPGLIDKIVRRGLSLVTLVEPEWSTARRNSAGRGNQVRGAAA